ncbi:MAG: hypothetical protein AB1716_09405 [Planctomycetota bacterium]
MLTCTCLVLAAATPDLLVALYWFGLIVGGGLLVFSALGALGHSGDFDAGAADFDAGAPDFHADAGGADFHADTAGADLHADAGADMGHADAGAAHTDLAHAAHGGHGALALSTWFSLRFVIFFLAFFGAAGVLLTYVTGLDRALTAGVAVLTGLVVGQAMHQTLRAVQRASGDSTTRPQDYVNRLGRVTISIEGNATGEVAVCVLGSERYLPAVARGSTTAFRPGDEIVVVAYRGGIAEVISRSEYERTRSA